jgi:hypothetical protein
MYRRNGGSVIGYTDYDYAGDMVKRRNTSGYLFMNAGADLLWGSNLQTTVAISTCEAELISGVRAIKEALWLRKLLAAINGAYCAVRLLMDNRLISECSKL